MSKSSDYARSQILQHLVDGQFHSGEVLGQTLGVSRAAVSKHVKALQQLGLDIFSVSGKGYRLATPIQLLAAEQVHQHLPGYGAKIEVLNVIGSTNQYIKDNLAKINSGHVCLAEAQTAGRGRHGRKWVSPYGASLYLSMMWEFAAGYLAIGGLSLAIGVAIARALDDAGIKGSELKWPNDVYLQGKKLSGVLIEVEGQMGAACQCVIGIGVNLHLPEEQGDIDQPWIDVFKATGVQVDRNLFAAFLINHLHQTLSTFEQHGLAPFTQEWLSRDLFKQQPIKLLMGNSEIIGRNCGINPAGGLLVESEGEIKAYYGGEVSVRGV